MSTNKTNNKSFGMIDYHFGNSIGVNGVCCPLSQEGYHLSYQEVKCNDWNLLEI